MKTFYFNTGVRPENVPNFPYNYHKEKGHKIMGTLCIPFDCEAPDNAALMFLCDNPELPESKFDNVSVYPVFNTSMVSKYVYFRINS